MMRHCDTLLMVGSNYPYAEFLPETGQARGVQIDLSAEHLSLRYPMEVNLHGDAKVTLAALLERLEQTDDLSWQSGVVEGMRSWNAVTEREAKVKADPINPLYVYHLLNERLPENSIVTVDAGSTADWYGHHIKLGPNMKGNLSGRLASMLAAMPYAIAGYGELPPLPPHISFDEAKGVAIALAKRDPAAGAVIENSVRAREGAVRQGPPPLRRRSGPPVQAYAGVVSATNITDELVRQIVDDLRERYKLDHADVQALGARLARPSDNRTAENHDFAERFVEQHRETFDRLAQ